VVLAPKPKKGAAVDETFTPDSGTDAVTGVDPAHLKPLLNKSIDYAKREFAKLRGGTATPQMLDHVMIEAYGERQPLTALAQVSLKNPQLFVVSPFDTAVATAISNAIRDAGLNLNPAVEGNVIRVPVPKPSKESRDANLKLVSKVAESAKVNIRRIRQEALDKLKKMEGPGMSSDEVFRQMKEIQALATTVTDEVTKLADKKKAEIEAA